jgi:hypothetical protein
VSPLLIAIGNLDFWFEVLDEYSGPEAARCGWLASQWTSFGDDITDADWVVLMHHAELLIAEWRARKKIADFANEINVPTTLDTATNRFLDAITKPYRRVA